MKSGIRVFGLDRLGAGIVLGIWLTPGASAATDESSQPVFQEMAAATKSLKRDLDETRARLADTEAALAKQTEAKKKAMNDVVQLWQQVKDGRENAETLRQQLAATSKQAAQARDLEKQVAGKSTQVADLQRQLDAAQANAVRLTQTLAEAQNQNQTLTRTSEQALQKQVEAHQAVEVARTTAEKRSLTLAQEKAQFADRVQELERTLEQQKAEQTQTTRTQTSQHQQELATLRSALTEKEQTVAQANRQVHELETQIATAQRQLQMQSGLEAARTSAETRAKGLEQKNAELAKAAQTQAGQQRQELATLRGALAEKDKTLAQINRQMEGLEQALATLKDQAQAADTAATAAQQKLQVELTELRHKLESQTAKIANLNTDRTAQDKQLALKTRASENLEAQLHQVQQAQRQQADELAQRQTQLTETIREAKSQKQIQVAELNRLREQMKEAALVRQGQALREQIGEMDHVDVIRSLNDVGLLLQAEGRLDQAQDMFQRALAVVEQTSNKASAAAGTILQHLADGAWSQNDLGSAAAYYEKAAQQFSAALGSAHPRHAAALNGWARVCQDQHQSEKAEELYRMAIHIYERDSAHHSEDLVAPLHNLGLLLMEENRLDEAGPLLERAEVLVRKNPQPDAERALIVARTLSRYNQAAGDLEQAARYDEQANVLALEALLK